MKFEIVKKDRQNYQPKPNLVDYKKTYANFNWQDITNELVWFKNGRLNAAYNAVDRHADGIRKNKVALYWEDEGGQKQEFSFGDIKNLSNKFANVLKKLKIKKGQRVFIFLPRLPELFITFLGILKTGAIVGTLFQAFGEGGLKDRLANSQARFLVTTRELNRRLQKIRKDLPRLQKIILINDKAKKADEVDYQKEMALASSKYKVKAMKPDDYAFMLYTSGTTGKPKGVMHTHGAILQQHITSKWGLDLREQDVYWCTADPGWVTGIVYEILGPWSNGVTQIIYAGRFGADQWYRILEKYQVTVWYTAPTAIRMLMKMGSEIVKKYNLSKLRHLCSVGEPLNPQAIRWGLKVFDLPFHDNWWQTETGAIMIANYPDIDIKLGSMGKPIPGIKAEIVDDRGRELNFHKEGNLAVKFPWPSMMKAIWRRPQKYHSYFIKGMACHERAKRVEWYISGDRAWKDKSGYFWFIGRADDVIKTAGERVGPFEVESALVEYPGIAEAGVIGKPDPERGEIIKAFVVLKKKQKLTSQEIKNIQLFVKRKLAGHAYPREIAIVNSLPKTRSGKIMRRILKAKELGLPIGDTSTLEEY